MGNVLILGANWSVARVAIPMFLSETDAPLSLYLRNAHRVGAVNPARVRVIEGDVLDAAQLRGAMIGQGVVYVNLAARSSDRPARS